jgi:hypothetical protein
VGVDVEVGVPTGVEPELGVVGVATLLFDFFAVFLALLLVLEDFPLTPCSLSLVLAANDPVSLVRHGPHTIQYHCQMRQPRIVPETVSCSIF